MLFKRWTLCKTSGVSKRGEFEGGGLEVSPGTRSADFLCVMATVAPFGSEGPSMNAVQGADGCLPAACFLGERGVEVGRADLSSWSVCPLQASGMRREHDLILPVVAVLLSE